MANNQLGIARQLGYVFSVGGPGVARDQLVPYDDPTSPLTQEEIAKLKKDGDSPGVIYPKR